MAAEGDDEARRSLRLAASICLVGNEPAAGRVREGTSVAIAGK